MDKPSIPSYKYPISTQHNTFMQEMTGVWCDKCGKYGSPAYKAVMDKYPGKVYGIEVHTRGSDFYPDPYANSVSNWMLIDAAARLGTSSIGVPSFWMNNVITSRDSLVLGQVVADAYASPAAGGLRVVGSFEGDSLKINAKTVFFMDTSGSFNVEVYLIEQNLFHGQYISPTEIVDPFPHKDVMRNAVWYGRGKQVASGDIKDGQVFDQSFSMYVDPSWKREDLSLVGVLQQMNGDTIITVLNATGADL